MALWDTCPPPPLFSKTACVPLFSEKYPFYLKTAPLFILKVARFQYKNVHFYRESVHFVVKLAFLPWKFPNFDSPIAWNYASRFPKRSYAPHRIGVTCLSQYVMLWFLPRICIKLRDIWSSNCILTPIIGNSAFKLWYNTRTASYWAMQFLGF